MERAEIVASRAGDLPVLPEVAAKVLVLVRDSNSSSVDLERLIARDAAISVKVLRIANSALFGFSGSISTLSRALLVLGFNTLRTIVVAASTESLYRTKGSHFKEQLLWEHSLAVAIAARVLARECRFVGAEEAFLAGLLHDIGKTVLDRNEGERYQAVIESVYNNGTTFLAAEKELLGYDHAEVGALILRRWNLAPALESAVKYHHEPESAEDEPTLCAIVSLANSLCVKLGIGPERLPDLDLLSLGPTLLLELDAEQLERIAATTLEQIAAERETFTRV